MTGPSDQQRLDVMNDLREDIVQQLESELRPLIRTYTPTGYNCCGCSTYDEILDHAIRIVKGES